MRRLKTAVAAMVLVGSSLFVGALPAHATPSLRGVVYDYSECIRIGNYGIQNYGWTGPLQCVWTSTGNGSAGLWFIYA